MGLIGQNVIQIPRIGKRAPGFRALSTNGSIYFPGECSGKWVMLFSHPADFIPVSSSDLKIFIALINDFKELNFELIGLSVDGPGSHFKWLGAVEEHHEFKDIAYAGVNFHLIADTNMEISSQYGMIHPEEGPTKSKRTVYFIDPDATIRAMINYPLSSEPILDELKSVAMALQTIDNKQVPIPANRIPGDKVMSHADESHRTNRDSIEITDEELNTCDCFFCASSGR